MTTDKADEAPSAPDRKRRGRWLKVTATVIVVPVLAALLIHQLTPTPYVLVFRSLIGQVEDSVDLGPYADRIDSVETSEVVRVPVEGAPDAELTMYTEGDSSEPRKPLIMLIHGGGWVVGAASQIGSFAKLLASEGFVVASLDYSLAPEHRYPTPIQQAVAAIDHLQDHAEAYGADPSRFFIGGNSAGAQISSQLGAIVTNPTFAQKIGVDTAMPSDNLRGLLLFNGPYDFDTIARDDFPGFRTYGWSYTGKKDYESYSRIDELSTVKNATPDYPPTYMTAGDADPLEPQTYELDAVLRSLGVDVTSRYWTGSGKDLPHDYMYDLTTDAAQTAYQDVVDFIRSHARR